MLTTTPIPSCPLLMMMAARILRPSRLCWMRAVRALKRWWLSMAIWSCSVLPLTGSCKREEERVSRALPGLEVSDPLGAGRD